MRTNRLPVFASALLMAVTLGGWTHGSRPIEGKDWKEALAKVPCPDVAKAGDDFKISAVVVVGGQSYSDPLITKKDLVELLEKQCPSKH